MEDFIYGTPPIIPANQQITVADETDPAIIDNTLEMVDEQRAMRKKEAIISHVTLGLLLVSVGLAIAGKGPMWLRSKWVIAAMIPTYIYTLHRMVRETYWQGAMDTQAVDGGAPII